MSNKHLRRSEFVYEDQDLREEPHLRAKGYIQRLWSKLRAG